MKADYPVEGELVVCKVKSVKNYGAFADLEEYGGKEGFVHVSNVASGWVKNIRSHVSEGQIHVGQVVNVDRAKNVIDVSFRKVSEAQEKRKLSEWKRTKRAEKLFERACTEAGEKPEECAPFAEKLTEEHGDLYTAFEAISIEGAKPLESLKLPAKLSDALVKICSDSIKPPSVSIRGALTLASYASNGVEVIKKALAGIASDHVKVAYISAPEYSLTVDAHDYVDAEKVLAGAVASIEKSLGKDGEAKFKRL
jgi:translation initiation factor 2 subunit 1